MTAGTHARPRRLGAARLALVLLVATGVAAAAVVYGQRLGSADEREAAVADCQVDTVAVTVAPRVERAVRAGLDALSSRCRRFEVTARSERQTLDAVFFGEEAPDLWVPDGDWGAAKLPMEEVSPALASTPVLLVGGARATAAPTWASALRSGAVALADPSSDSVGTLAMMAPRVEAEAAGADPDTARAVLVPTAQSYGELASQGQKVDVSLDTITPTDARLVATTEADYLAAGRSNEALREVTPATGAALLTFPLLLSDDAAEPARRAATDLAAWFDSPDGAEARRAASLRDGSGAPLPGGAGLGKLAYLSAPASADVDDYRLTWQVLSVPSSVLAVFDVSGSMDFAGADGVPRIDVAVGAATVALDSFPDHARIGLWAFSIDQGGPGQDWRVLEPVRRLDARVGGVLQRDRLAARAEEMPTLTEGGTGLHDTTLAAYQQALRNYDPDYANTVILLTDGANDDPGSISETALVRRLRTLVDPRRPVRIVGVGVSDDADLGALERIAEATNGRAYRADTPEDILRVFSQEIARR